MKKIDIATWNRRHHYDFFHLQAPCFNLSFPLDITSLHAYTHQKGISFYLSLVYLFTQEMNKIENFRYCIVDEEVYIVDRLHPVFTHLKKGAELFHITPYYLDEPMEVFCHKAKVQTEKQEEFIGPCSSLRKEDLIYFSSFPWVEMISLTNEHDSNPNHSIPRVTWGKYIEWDGRLKLNVSVEANHRLVDGYHIGQLALHLQQWIDEELPRS